jgi:hypothetical protein
MKCAIRAKFGLKAFSPDEWESTNRNKPMLYQGRLRTTHAHAVCGRQQQLVENTDRRCVRAGLFFKRVCDMMGIVMANQPAIFEELNAHSRSGQPNKFEFLGEPPPSAIVGV